MVNIEYGEPQKDENGNEFFKELALDKITKNETDQMSNAQRKKFYKEGISKYGTKEWERRIIDIDYIELNKEDELDVENYNINDLFDLLDLNKDDFSENSIVEAVDVMKYTLDENSNSDNMENIIKYKKFFEDAGKKLKEFKKKGITETSDNLIQTPDISKIKRKLISCSQTMTVNSNFDIPQKVISTICPDGSFQYNVDRYQKTNFEVFLEFKLSDTSKLILGNVIIPLSGYFSIDSAYNTNSFTIKDISNNKTTCIELPPQQPKPGGNGIKPFVGFISSFQESLTSVNITDLSLNVGTGSNTGFFEISTTSVTGYEIDWLAGDCDTLQCIGQKSNPTTRDRPTSTLGFLMGFNTDQNGGKIIITNAKKARAERGYSSMIGSKIFYLQLTDYTGSTINYNKVHISKPIQTFKQPYYFNSIKTRIGIDNSLNFCEKYKETNKRSSRKGTANNTDINIMDTLSQAQKYTMKAIEAANNKINGNTNDPRGASGPGGPGGGTGGSPGAGTGAGTGAGKTIQFPIPREVFDGSPDTLVHPIRFSGRKDNVCPILFTGITDIIKIGIALLDENGFLVDLHGEGIIVTFNTDQKKTEIGKS